MSATPSDHPELPQVVLKPRRALPLFSRHPWVFSTAIHHVKGDPAPGAEVQVLSDRGDFIARGLFNPDSHIVVRLYSWGDEGPLDEAFWSARLDEAIRLRHHVLGWNAPQGGCRLIFSEADGLSGLTVDRYADWLLVQFTSRALAEHKDVLLRLLQEKLKPAGIWLRTEKGIREQEGLNLADGPLTGNSPPQPLILEENGLRFGVDLTEGQKTGFFLDQRMNRQLAGKVLRGPRVLDLFCYTGAFAINVATAGHAQEILAVDVSESALKLARANAELNGVTEKIRFEKADIFKWLEHHQATGAKYQSIILDPPKMARHRRSIPEALQGYEKLNRRAMQLLEPDGLLLTCSCSGLVDRANFEAALAEAANQAGRRLQILESHGAAADHPVSVHCLENNYLKAYLCRVI